MSRLLNPAATATIERVLSACGGGHVLHIGPGADAIAGAYRRMAVKATGLSIEPSAIDESWRTPYGDRSFDLVCAYGVLDTLPDRSRGQVFDELLRISRGSVLLYASGQPRARWEAACLARACRKHPLHQLVVPYDGLDWLPDPSVMLFERLPDDATICRSVADLAQSRDLHMDMLREGGRRADAHVARYMLARQYIRPGDRVLDAACGLGYGSAILADSTLAERVLGLDVDVAAILYANDHYARHRQRLKFEAQDLESLGRFGAGSFDAIVSFETLEHIKDPDAFLALCRRMLTPGGRLICSVPNEWVDETGTDPNPYHLHVFDRAKLEAACRRHFLVEKVYGQTAGGGMKLPGATRAIWPAGEQSPDAEWWLLAGMTPPTDQTTEPFRHGLLEAPADDSTHVLAFERDYENPWLVRAMVTVGLRTESGELLDGMAEATLAAAQPMSADEGAALCVQAYRHLTNGAPAPEDLLTRIEDYCSEPATVPHVRRWQISLRYVEALLRLEAGDWDRATAALETCAQANALEFSSLLATKTVGAALMRGWLAAQARDVKTARHWWNLGILHAEQALQRPWEELMLSRESPALFGLREAALVVDLASRCATGLHLLPHLLDRPGVMASQIFESLAERSRRETSHNLALTADVATLNQALAAAHEKIGELDRERAGLSWRIVTLTEKVRASALINDGEPLPPSTRVAVFGGGSGGRQAIAMLQSRGAVVDCVADNDPSRHGGTLEGIPVVNPSTLPDRQVDAIVVASLPGRLAIFAQLEAMGFVFGRDFDYLQPAAAGVAAR